MKIVMLAQAGSVHTARWCAGLVARGHTIYLISNDWNTEPIPGVETIFLPGHSSLDYVKNILRVKRTIRQIAPDIVHAHYATGFGLWGSAQNSAPLVLSVWGTDIVDAKKSRFLVAPITRRALRMAQVITATSRFLVEETVRFYPVAKSKIVHVPFGIAMNVAGSRSPKRGKAPLVFIFAKLYLRNYGPDLVVKAYAQALGKMPPSHLKMIGGGPMKNELVKLAQELSLENQVSIGDYVPYHQATIEISNADIMLMPSYNESFGVAAVEAASYGVPVIATRVGGIPEIIRDNENGILIPSGDIDALANAMIRLANDSDVRTRMGEAGVKIARDNYDEQICLDKMEAVYRKVLAG